MLPLQVIVMNNIDDTTTLDDDKNLRWYSSFW
jgi:hypothetical protein